MRIRYLILAVLMGAGISSCGSNKFEAGGGSANPTFAEPELGQDFDDSDSKGDVSVGEPTDREAEALDRCLGLWGVDNVLIPQKVKKIRANIGIGAQGITLQDTQTTDDASLILLKVSVNVGGNPIWRLENPNGWYCIMVNVNVGANLRVQLHPGARLADSSVAVKVGGEGQPVGRIGVQVGGSTTVEGL